jgi:phage repressor protein C with HTH and peptisase S24 domain
MESKELISQRFIEAIDRLKDDSHVSSDAAFCRSISILPQTLPDIKAKKRDVTLEIIANTCNTYGLESGYFFGQTDKFYTNKEVHTNTHTLTHTLKETQNQTVQVKYAENNKTSFANEPGSVYKKTNQNQGQVNQVYIIDEQVRAGLLVGFTQDNVKNLQPISLPWLGKGIFYIFKVRGDSMYPTLTNGDSVLAKQVLDFQLLRRNEVYVLVSKEGMIIKRLKSVSHTDKLLTYTSDNEEEYPATETMPLNGVMGIFEVIEYISGNLGKNNNDKQQLKLYKALLEANGIKI